VILRRGLYDGENNPFYNKIHSEETKQLMREFHLSKEGHVFSKIGEESVNYGKKHSLERKLNLSVKVSGKNNPGYGHTYATPPQIVRESLRDYSLVEEYTSIRHAAIELKSSAQTIKKYAQNGG